MLEIQLRRGDELLGVLARLREVLPGRYAFGLQQGAVRGGRLRRGSYVVQVVAPRRRGAPAGRGRRLSSPLAVDEDG